MWAFENVGVGFILVLLLVFNLYTMCMLCEILRYLEGKLHYIIILWKWNLCHIFS
jgi:hypothetical protein